jgi:SAM-dependent methyltransferase
VKWLAGLHRHAVFRRRVRVLAARLAALLPANASVLDVGCGDGSIDRLIAERRPDARIAGIDVRARAGSVIPVREFDGRTIPYADDSVDIVMFVDVLHHTTDPVRLLEEAARVARHAIVLKDHTRDGWLAGPTLRLMDWFGNAPHGVDRPHTYWRETEWRETFRRLGLTPTVWIRRVGLYPAPVGWWFDRSLHFVARLELA